MAALGAEIVEALVAEYGRAEVLRRLSDPGWFQAFGCLLGMDWHSSGITTSVIGALKRGLRDREHALGLHVCGGRGAHARKTPGELQRVADHTGLDGAALARASRLVAKVDNNALQDGFGIYLHAFVLTDDGDWTIVQQGMNPDDRTARRYHWRSDTAGSFTDEPHQAVVGRPVGTVLNLTDHRAAGARDRLVDLSRQKPDAVVREVHGLRHLALPAHHDVRPSDVVLSRLHAVVRAAGERGPVDFADLLLVPGVGPRTVAALALCAEVLHASPSRFSDPARFAFAHGGKDGHPYPVRTDVYDRTVASLRTAVRRARIGERDRLEALRRLDHHRRRLERAPAVGPRDRGLPGPAVRAAPGDRVRGRGQLALPLGGAGESGETP